MMNYIEASDFVRIKSLREANVTSKHLNDFADDDRVAAMFAGLVTALAERVVGQRLPEGDDKFVEGVREAIKAAREVAEKRE